MITARTSVCDCSRDWSCWLLSLGERTLRLCGPPCSAQSAGQGNSLTSLLDLKDSFHEAVATSVPLFKTTVYQTSVLEPPNSPPPNGTGNLIFWIIYLKLYLSGVMCNRKETWSHQSLFNFTSVRGNIFASCGPRGSLESKHQPGVTVLSAMDNQDRTGELHVGIEGLRWGDWCHVVFWLWLLHYNLQLS